MIYPSRLRKGDTVGIISPASPPDEQKIKRGITIIEKLGLKVTFGKHTFKKNNYLAGTDDERLADFHDMIKNKDIKAIIFSRGGYGSARIADKLDYTLIKNNPKIIWGYSDITYLHTAIRQNSHLITFHGPMIITIGKNKSHFRTKQTFDQLFKKRHIVYDESISPLHVINEGTATGQIVGGNLSVIMSTLGTPYEIDLYNKILLIEDVDEPLYKIDSMLNQLMKMKKLIHVRGIIVGDFKLRKKEQGLKVELNRLLTHYLKRLNVPIMTGFKIGHCEPNIAIPLGTKASFATRTKTLIVKSGIK